MAPNLFVREHELIWEDPEIYVVRVPYAHLGLSHTNCYFVRSGEDVLVIDPGVKSALSNITLTRAASSLGIKMDNARFLCTHLHFDHAAMLKELTRPGSQILVSETAYQNNPWNHYRLRKSLLRSMMLEEGVPAVAMRGLAAHMSESRVCNLPDREYQLLRDGDEVHVGPHAMRVIETPGHSRGHICLFSEAAGFLMSGDHVLEDTTTGMSLPFEGDNSVRDYLDSLAKVEDLACTAVLPGHGEAFYDLAGRSAQTRDHHAKRLAQIYETVAFNPGANGYTITRAMPWKSKGPFKNWNRLNPYLQLSMLTQALAYLEFLVRAGELERVEDEDGRHYHLA